MDNVAAKSFRDLIVWQKAHTFVLNVYRVCVSEGFPADERYGVTSQLRRAAVSIAANIVEGFRKRGPADKLRFFNIAQGFGGRMPLLPRIGSRFEVCGHCPTPIPT
jgi:hypothetical protein